MIRRFAALLALITILAVSVESASADFYSYNQSNQTVASSKSENSADFSETLAKISLTCFILGIPTFLTGLITTRPKILTVGAVATGVGLLAAYPLIGLGVGAVGLAIRYITDKDKDGDLNDLKRELKKQRRLLTETNDKLSETANLSRSVSTTSTTAAAAKIKLNRGF